MNKIGHSNPLLKISQACLYLATIHQTASFTRAAEKLGVHQSAVSHRIKQLEEQLGFDLYKRSTRMLIPTEAGTLLGEAATLAMSEFTHAMTKIEAKQKDATIRLSISSSLALKWLVPRLSDAEQAGLNISLLVQERATNLFAAEADAVIRFGHGPFSDLHSEHLCDSVLQAVVSPHYSHKNRVNERTPWASDVTLLGDKTGETDGTHFSWTALATSNGFSDDVIPTQYFERADLLLQAAINGLGVAIGRSLLIEGDIKNGFLKKIGPTAPMKSAYWLLCTKDTAKNKQFQKFSNWLHQQMQQMT